MVKTHGSIVLRVFALFAVLSGVIITLTDAMSSQVNAEESVVASVAVEPACSFGVENTEHTDTIAPGNNREGIGGDTIFTIYCNDMDGYVVYAVGYSNDEEGTTAMIGSDTAVGNNIATGTATTGSTSNWSYKVQLTSSDTDGIVLPASNSAFTAIPNTRTAVMQRETGRPSGGDKFNVSYAVYVSDTQVPGTYTGKVRYTLFQPHSQGPYPLSMQKVAEWIDTVDPGDTITVMDERDGNTYRVRLLADGQLWMIDNLRLGDSKLTNRTLTSDNTDLNGIGSYNLSKSSRDGFQSGDYIAENIYVVESDSDNEKEIYGGYYTWNAATAGTGASVTSEGANAPSSICPKGWRLPTSGGNGEFKALNDKLGGITDGDAHLINPDGPAFLRAGYYLNGASAQGSVGYYWSSTSCSSNNAYHLDFSSAGVGTWDGNGRYLGFSVRCVADPSTPYNISYNLTGGSGGPDPNPQTGATIEATITLDSKTPSKNGGFIFQHWCSVNNTADPSTCSGETYEAGATYDLSKGAVTTLYAVWKFTGTNLGDLGDMQSFSCTKISNIGDYGTVRDTRDSNTYRVRKLADDKCWMIDNLRLGDSKLANRTLTSANTDLNGIASYKLPNNSKSGFKSGDYTAQNIYVVEADSGKELKVYGGYYTFNAATAGTGASVTSGANASSSICPKGWRLPTTSYTGGDFQALNDALGSIVNSDANLINPDGPAFFRAGYYYNGSASSQGSYGFYWSSTGSSSNYAYLLLISGTSVTPSNDFGRYYGAPVRCLAE